MTDKVRRTSLTILLIFLTFLACAVGLHYRGFHSPMVYDSRGYIENKAHVFEQHRLLEVVRLVPARPLFMTTLYLNYLVAGMDAPSLRWTNGIMLAGTGLVLVVMFAVLFSAPGLPASAESLELYGVCIFLGLLFVIHPLQRFVVLYIVQREALMACFFYFAAVTVYVAGRSGRLGPDPRPQVYTAVLFFLGVMSKENVVTLPIVLLLAELTLFHQNLRGLRQRALNIAGITLLPLAGYLVLTRFLEGTQSVHTSGAMQRLIEYYQDAGVNPLEVVLTQCRVLLLYLYTMLAPSMTGLPLLRAEVLSRSLWNPPITVAALAVIIALFVAGLALARRRPVAAMGILFFLVVSLPEALCIPQYLFCGYRAILPMAGVLLVVGDCLLWVLPKVQARLSLPRFAVLAAIAAVLPVAYLSTVSVEQAGRWNPLLFWQDQYERLPPFSDQVAYRPYSDILANYGEELVATGQFTKAIKVLRDATAMEMATNSAWSGPEASRLTERPSNTGVADAKANLRIRGSRGSKTAALVNEGAAFKQAGNLPEAVKIYRQAVEIDSRSALAHYGLAGALKECRDFPDAIWHYQKAFELDPTFAAAHNGLGLALEESGNPQEAMREYRKAVELNPSLAEAQNNLAAALEKSGQLLEAIHHYTTALQSNPGLAQAHHNLGLLLVKLGKPIEASEHLKKAAELEPRSAMSYTNLGLALEASGNLPLAMQNYQQALALSPTSADAHYVLGNALLKSGRPKEAVPYFRKAVDLNPGFLEAHANLGLVLLGLGDIPHAIGSLQKAVEIDSKSAGLHNALGVALARLGKRDEAIDHFHRAVSLDPTDARPRENLQKLFGEK